MVTAVPTVDLDEAETAEHHQWRGPPTDDDTPAGQGQGQDPGPLTLPHLTTNPDGGHSKGHQLPFH